ncbi:MULTISPECIES: DUF6124 family protein [Pseudomonas]|uniref:DUF3077 domain-containing protein n=2 Tax=Pseudomonas fluorescens group TaxID=136843 RepID=A0A423L9N9_PSEFL|nr:MULTISPECIES: hypothetical protein [Pseudomonas]MDR9864068.1 hypothetical protein [Pseudomonas baetica]PKA69435.1 hypothetical protein ATI02_2285 [Pseudomonas baetica]PTC20760.1 hypothetical protein C0J26_04435 [Pseudomonas baetica]RON65018.1 hypothetical protein BK671_18155 [Pseudomonas fluorescens]
MKKITRLTLVGPVPADGQTPGLKPQPDSTGSSRRPRRTIPLKQMLSVRDDVDTLTLLAHASDLLDSLAVISANFADEFDGSKRHVAVAIKQLSALAEIVICRARDQVMQQGSPTSSGPEVRH